MALFHYFFSSWIRFYCTCISYFFFIHLYVSRLLGCFHVLAIVNSASMNIEVHVSCWIRVLSRYMPRSEFSRSGDFIFNLLKKLLLFSMTLSFLMYTSVWYTSLSHGLCVPRIYSFTIIPDCFSSLISIAINYTKRRVARDRGHQ